METATFTSVLEIVAVIVSALSAMITASRKHLDLVGTYALALVTSFGGGTIRDVLLDRRPLFWVQHWEYLVVVLALCIPFVYSRRVYESASRWEQRFTFVDALGIALFGLSGLLIARDGGMPVFVATLIGVITATFGGVIRDVVINEIPLLFRPGGLYASAVFAGCWFFVALTRLGVHDGLAVLIAFAAIVALRMASVLLDFTLPAPQWLRDLHDTGEFPVGSEDRRDRD